MQEESNSILTTLKYYKNILKFPSFPKNYSELDESTEQSELFFCNSKQRKEESLRLLKEWASNRMDLFEKNREIVEELANSCDYRIRLSVDFLQIVYKFFNEKYFHEQQYSQFLLTKPQPALKQNPLSQQLYLNVGQAISSFEENNLKRCEKIGIFAHTIQTQILKAETFQELSEMDKKLDLLLSTIITQKKLLQNYITSASQKLNLIIQQFPQQQNQQRVRKPIFDDQNEQQQPQSRTEKILTNISALGTLLVGATSLQDPVELELNQQMKEQEKQIREQQLKEEQSLSNGVEQQDQSEQQNQSALQLSDINEVLADVQSIEQQQEQVEKVDNGNQEQQKENQVESTQNNIIQNVPVSYAQQYKSQQLLKERQQYELNQQKSKNYSTQSLPIQQQNQKQQQEQLQQNTKKQQPQDLYKLIISFVATQQYANKLLNQLAEKVVQYWKQVIAIENKRAQWAKASCDIYNQGLKEVHQINIELNEIQIDVDSHYHFLKLMPKEIGQLDCKDAEDFTQSLIIKEIGCPSARLLLVKEFKVHIIEKTSEIPAILVLTIDKYVGCWYKHEETIEAVDNPVIHYPIAGMATQKVSENILDIMPSRHLLFLNIANDRQKSRVKFSTADDMEEFSTITQQK